MIEYEQRKAYKDKKFQLTNQIWCKHHLNSRKNVGCLNQIIKQFYNINKSIFNTLTCDDFQKYYFTIISKKDFLKVVNKFYSLCCECGMKITKTEAYQYCVIRVIDETWDGFQRELRIAKQMELWYPDAKIQFSTDNDVDYCIDLEVYYDEMLLDVFQIKPYSFLAGLQNKKEYCINAYFDNYKKHKEFHEQNKIIPCYVIEHGHELIIKRYDELTY